jgi:hypothetical protein
MIAPAYIVSAAILGRPAPTTSADQAQLLFDVNRPRLEELAARALAKGHTCRTCVIVCIEVDSNWRELVDTLMPGHDWQPLRDAGDVPTARGSVGRAGLVELLSLLVPDIAQALKEPPPACSTP